MNWRDVIERAVWTGIQAPAAVALFDYFNTSADLPAGTLFAAAGIGFGLAAVKSIAKDRLEWLRRKGRHSE